MSIPKTTLFIHRAELEPLHLTSIPHPQINIAYRFNFSREYMLFLH